MILVLNMCSKDMALSRYEFVDPIVHALESHGADVEVVHYADVTPDAVSASDGVVLCGTALCDNAFAAHAPCFGWIRDSPVPVLGICAGMQAISLAYCSPIEKRSEIGLCQISIEKRTDLLGEKRAIEGYHLHSHTPSVPQGFDVIATSKNGTDAFCHRTLPIYGIIFHPEVRNTWVLGNFIKKVIKK